MGKVRRLPAPAVENPFEYHIQWTLLSKVEIIFGAIFVFPVRIVLLAVGLFLLYLCGVFCSYDVRPKGSRMMRPVQRFALQNVMHFVIRFVLFTMGYNWIHIKGRRASLKEAPVAVVAPHSSFMDAVFVGSKVYSSCLMKDEALDMPIFGKILACVEPVTVKRSSKSAGGHGTVDEVKKRLEEPDAWTQLLFFPEGTCTNAQALICFKAGPFYPGVPVQPVLFRLSGWETWTFISHSGYLAFFMLMCRLHNSCTVEYLPVYHPSDEEKKNPFLYASNVRDQMAKSLGTPHTDHTYEDSILMRNAINLGLPPNSGLVQYNRVHQVTNLNLSSLEELLVRFAEADSNKDGRLSQSEFSDYLHWPIEQDVTRIFNEYDTSEEGAITFCEFVMGYADLSLPAVSIATASKAFSFLSGSDACVTEQSLELAFSERGAQKNCSLLFRRMCPDSESLDEVQFSDFLSANPEFCVLFMWLLDGNE